jgi:hypothetical protein
VFSAIFWQAEVLNGVEDDVGVFCFVPEGLDAWFRECLRCVRYDERGVWGVFGEGVGKENCTGQIAWSC